MKTLILNKTSLDLLFIMDITGSMKPFLAQVKNNVINIINRITLECPGIDIYLGFVAYTESNEIHLNANIEFTKNYQYLESMIKNLNASGGGDGPEDISWGIERALEKNWKSNARYAILIADAPCHGSKYHSSYIPDIYPDGDPSRRNIEELIKNMAEINIKPHNNTRLFFCQYQNCLISE